MWSLFYFLKFVTGSYFNFLILDVFMLLTMKNFVLEVEREV